MTFTMKKAKRRFIKIINFFSWLIDHELEKELEKNLRIAFSNGFCSISAKWYRSGETRRHEMLYKHPYFTTGDRRLLLIFVFVLLLFLNFGREGELGFIILCPIIQNIHNYDKLQPQ